MENNKLPHTLQLLSLYLTENGYQQIHVQTLLNYNWINRDKKGGGFRKKTYIINENKYTPINIVGRNNNIYYEIRETEPPIITVQYYTLRITQPDDDYFSNIVNPRPKLDKYIILFQNLNLTDPQSLDTIDETIKNLEKETGNPPFKLT